MIIIKILSCMIAVFIGTTFTMALRTSVYLTRCYGQQKMSIFRQANSFILKRTKVFEVRKALLDYIGINVPDEEIKPSKLESAIFLIHGTAFGTLWLEQTMLIDWFLFPQDYAKSKIKFRDQQVKLTLQIFHSDIEQIYKGNNYMELLYHMYLLIQELAKRLKISSVQSYILDPVYKEMFKKVDKSNINYKGIRELAEKYGIKDPVRFDRRTYEVSMLIKTLYFLHPQFSQNKQVKSFTFNRNSYK